MNVVVLDKIYQVTCCLKCRIACQFKLMAFLSLPSRIITITKKFKATVLVMIKCDGNDGLNVEFAMNLLLFW